MSRPRTVAIVVDAADPVRVGEAWRAAVGVSLRGARVTVATVDGSGEGGPAAARARATLALFGHDVEGDPAALAADVIELWRDDGGQMQAAAPPRAHTIVHLVRAGRRAAAVAPGDRVLQLDDDVDHAAILDALIAADVACVW